MLIKDIQNKDIIKDKDYLKMENSKNIVRSHSDLIPRKNGYTDLSE